MKHKDFRKAIGIIDFEEIEAMISTLEEDLTSFETTCKSLLEETKKMSVEQFKKILLKHKELRLKYKSLIEKQDEIVNRIFLGKRLNDDDHQKVRFYKRRIKELKPRLIDLGSYIATLRKENPELVSVTLTS